MKKDTPIQTIYASGMTLYIYKNNFYVKELTSLTPDRNELGSSYNFGSSVLSSKMERLVKDVQYHSMFNEKESTCGYFSIFRCQPNAIDCDSAIKQIKEAVNNSDYLQAKLFRTP